MASIVKNTFAEQSLNFLTKCYLLKKQVKVFSLPHSGEIQLGTSDELVM